MPYAVALRARSLFIVNAANAMLMRSMKDTTSARNRNQMSRRKTLRNVLVSVRVSLLDRIVALIAPSQLSAPPVRRIASAAQVSPHQCVRKIRFGLPESVQHGLFYAGLTDSVARTEGIYKHATRPKRDSKSHDYGRQSRKAG